MPPVNIVSNLLKNSRVNLFVVGVNKSGTSWLYHLLKEHPQINMSERKELYYFGQEYPDAIDEYHSHFDINHKYLYFGEATPIYYRDPEIADQIKEYNPSAKLIVIVRDPIDRFLSQFYFQKQIGKILEKTTVEQFLAGDTRVLLSDSHYENTMPSFSRLFDSDQLFVNSLEAAKADPEAFWQNVIEFLEVESIPLPLPRDRSENPTGSKWFRRIYRATIQPIKQRNYSLYESMLKSQAVRRAKLGLLKLTGLAKKEELSPVIMQRLVEEFEPTYEYLKLLNISGISHPGLNADEDKDF